MSVKQVKHGISGGRYASITTSKLGAVTFGTPKPFIGLRGVSFETSQDSTALYADNELHLRLMGAKSTEGTITCYQFPIDFTLGHLGYSQMNNGLSTDTGSHAHFAFQYVERVTDSNGQESEELHIWYNLKASTPTESAQTDEESPEGKEFEIPLTANPSSGAETPDGKLVTHAYFVKNEENARLFELAKTQIILPDTPIPVSKPVVGG